MQLVLASTCQCQTILRQLYFSRSHYLESGPRDCVKPVKLEDYDESHSKVADVAYLLKGFEGPPHSLLSKVLPVHVWDHEEPGDEEGQEEHQAVKAEQKSTAIAQLKRK